jgi:hypothetical protein
MRAEKLYGELAAAAVGAEKCVVVVEILSNERFKKIFFCSLGAPL